MDSYEMEFDIADFNTMLSNIISEEEGRHIEVETYVDESKNAYNVCARYTKIEDAKGASCKVLCTIDKEGILKRVSSVLTSYAFGNEINFTADKDLNIKAIKLVVKGYTPDTGRKLVPGKKGE